MSTILTLFRRHIIATIFIVFYFCWWYFVINFFRSGASQYPHSCGAANAGLIFLTGILMIIYIIALLIRILMVKDKGDYLKFMALVFLPVLVAFILLVS